MESYDARYQTKKNGPLAPSVRQRLQRFQDLGYTLAEIGEALGFSGAFAGQLMKKTAPANVRSRHVPRIIEVLEEAEIREGISKVSAQKPRKEGLDQYSIEDLLVEIITRVESHRRHAAR